jgi:xyloglucan-specific exo-beta-1,4-glucanase
MVKCRNRGRWIRPGISYSATERGLVYARTDIGGAYRLDSTTGRWIPLMDSIGFDDPGGRPGSGG